MNPKEMCVLLIGHDPADERVVRETLAHAQEGLFAVECATRLSEGLEHLHGNGIAAIILDLNLPDCQGLASFKSIWRAAPHIPILIIAWPIDQDIANQAIKLGAQDCLLKPQLNSSTLPKTLRRMIERKAADEALFLEQQRAEVTLNSIGDAVICIDVAGRVTYLNVVGERMTGWSRQNALRRPFEEIFHLVDSATRDRVPNPLAEAIRLDDTIGLTPNCLLIRPDGFETPIEDSASPIRDRGGQVIGAVMVFHDVSAARALAIQATHVAQHDFLTQLPNRLLLHDRLSQAIALATRHGHRLAVLFLDLDRFKHVNDSLGHVIGDGLLQSVARRLLTCVRSSDTVSRQGGDEFVVLLSEIDHADDAATSAQKIIAAFVEPHDVAQHHLHVTTTVGISVYPDDGTDPETLIACADTAMYHAKEHGRNTYRFFERNMNARAVERQSIEAGLHQALARREFALHYQPKIDLETGALTGAEALIRWGHPERGLMLPKDFVPIAEDSGLIVPIGQWVLREACRQARAWIDEGRPPMAVAVNVSVAEFRDVRFVEHVRSVLRETRLDARYLELELTERSLMQHADATAFALRALKNMGVRVAIDDFGTGHSSLSCLRQFPITGLKVDQSFVHEISSDPVGTSIVCAVISMGKSLGHRVVAEGVETQEQLAFLQSQRCGEGQGYYFSRPLVAEQFAKLSEAGLPQRVQQ